MSEINLELIGGEPRVFLDIAEAREWVQVRELEHLKEINIPFQGRDQELQHYREFLEQDYQKICIIYGAGGIGKTRFLLEGAEKIALPNGRQVLWANVATLETTSSSFDGLVIKRPTLFLIDEPEDPKKLKALVEQLASGRTKNWQVAIAVRSFNDPVLRYFQSPRIQQIVKKLELAPLQQNPATAFCEKLLELGSLREKTPDWRTAAAKKIAQWYGGYPIWMAIAINVLEKNGNLEAIPQETQELASEYLEEIITKQQTIPQEKVLNLLQWVALLHTVNREETAVIKFIQTKVGCNPAELERYFRSLSDRKIIFARGARDRLLEIKPDILADYILRDWLIESDNQGASKLIASHYANEIIQEVSTILDASENLELPKFLLRGIARFELIQQSLKQPINILQILLEDWYDRVPSMKARQKLTYLNLLDEISFGHVSEVLDLLRAILNSTSETETISTIFGEITTTHDHVILALPSIVYNTARYAQNNLEQNKALLLLCDLVIKENSIRPQGLPNDGKRADTILSRIITGSREFLSNFSKSAFAKAIELLENIRSEQKISDEQKLRINALIKPLLSLEQENTSFDGRTITVQRWFITPDESNESRWGIRNSLCKTIQEILSERKLPPPEATILWDLLNYAYGEINQILLELSRDTSDKPPEYQEFHIALSHDLQWIANLLNSHTLDIQEITAARRVWDWHYKFKKFAELAEIAEKCENLFKQNQLFPQYAPLITEDYALSWQKHGENLESWATETSQKLINENVSQSIHEFVQNGIKFLGNPDQVSRLFVVAYRLGVQAQDSPVICSFVEESLKLDVKDSEFQFATRVAHSWIRSTRQNNPAHTTKLLELLLQWVKADEQVVQLIQAIYESAWLIDIPEQEVEIVLQQGEHFLRANSAVSFIGLLGSIFPFSSSEKIQNTIEITLGKLEKLDRQQLSMGLGAFLQSLNYAMRNYIKRHNDQKIKPQIPNSLRTWVLNQVLHLPDIDNLSSINVQYLQELLQILGKPNLTWLVHAIEKRVQLISESNSHHIQILPGQKRLSQWITPISVEQNDDTTRSLMRKLLSYADSNPILGYRLPQYLVDTDPKGIITPDLVLEKLTDPNVREDPNKIWQWAKFAGYYPDNSIAWYKIAHEVCSLAVRFGDRYKYSIFHALTNPEPKMSVSLIGEISPTLENAVEVAKDRLESEKDPDLLPFWQWMLKVAQEDLSREVERVTQENDEWQQIS